MKIKIDGMSCGNCVAHVREALEALDGVTQVDVKLEENAAYIEGNVSEDIVRETIDEAGYDVVGIE